MARISPGAAAGSTVAPFDTVVNLDVGSGTTVRFVGNNRAGMIGAGGSIQLGGAQMRVRLLGPVDVVVDGSARPVSGLRRKAVLAALALHAGEIVSTDRLVGIVWGDAPPAGAPQTVQSHVSHLRGVLGDRSAILARGPGYVLDGGADITDVRSAEDLIRQGSDSPDAVTSASRLQAAVDLWRGPALADITGLVWFDEQAQRLEQLRQQARHALIDARLELGQHTELIGELRELVRRNPHHEQTHAQLILALYRSGRQGDALAAYQQLRQTLDDNLGIGPSPALRELQAAILRQDPAIDPPPPRSPALPRTGPIPAQLPLAPGGFTGRRAELAALDRLLTAAAPHAVIISAVSGTAGIGKTTLAIHWAHRVAAHFPDGQLHVNLRGYHPTGTAVDPAEALRGFLDALNIPADRIPVELQAQVTLYRTHLAGKRVLVLLDNARDAEQVRPLLPSTPGSLAIITSRSELSGLSTTGAAHPLTLDLLTPTEAHDLLTHRLGTARTTAEPGAVHDIITRCARLPLALAIVAARAATQPSFPLATIAGELARTTNTLDGLDNHDPAADIRTVFSWSLNTLSPDANQLFRHLALHPGPDITTPAAASLAGLPPHRAHQLLTELTRANLLTQPTPGRYAYHDLLRAYATEQTHTHDTAATRHTITHRLLDHYLHTAHTAALLLHPTRVPIGIAPTKAGVTPEAPADQDAALAWFTTEHAVLLAAIERAAAAGFDSHTWQLAWAFTTYLLRQGHWSEHITTQHTALAATHRLGHRAAQADILHGLARSYLRLGVVEDASTHFQRALDVCADLGDPTGEAHNHMGLAEVAERQERPADALRHNEEALELFRTVGDRVGEANTLNGIGWCHLLLDNYPQALVHCTQGLDLLVELDDQDGQAATWDSLGCIHRGLADYEQAIICHHRSIDLCRDIGDRYWEADALTSLGDTLQVAGDAGGAHKAWQDALTILDELDHQKAEQLRAKLPDGAGPPPQS